MTDMTPELIRYRLEKARETLKDAQLLANSERWTSHDRRHEICSLSKLSLMSI